MLARLDALLVRLDCWIQELSRGWSASAETLIGCRFCCCL